MDWFSFSIGGIAGALVTAWGIFFAAVWFHKHEQRSELTDEQLRVARRSLH